MTRDAGESRGRRAGATLAAFLLGSIAVHAAALVMLPAMEFERGRPGVVALEVALLTAEPLAVVPGEPSARSEPRSPRPESHPARAITELQAVRVAPLPMTSGLKESEGPTLTSEPARMPEPAVAASEPGGGGLSHAQTAGASAAYLRSPPPTYPLASRRAGEQGTVTLRVLVTREGMPQRVELEKSSGSAHLDNAALEAVKAWRFTPARRGADAVESWMRVPIVFRLESAS